MMIPRMRTVDEAVTEIKRADPNTCVTGSMLRRWQREGKLPYITVGKKHLINLDTLIQILETGFEVPEEPVSENEFRVIGEPLGDYGRLRKITV